MGIHTYTKTTYTKTPYTKTTYNTYTKLCVSFAKEPKKRDYILPKRPIILRSLLIVAT